MRYESCQSTSCGLFREGSQFRVINIAQKVRRALSHLNAIFSVPPGWPPNYEKLGFIDSDSLYTRLVGSISRLFLNLRVM